MIGRARWRVLFLVAPALLLVARPALADLPLGVEVAAVGRGGEPPGGNPPNSLGLGLGVRAGVTLLGFYGGLSFVNYFGTDGGGHATLLGAVGGVGVELVKGVTLRGQLGAGWFSGTYVLAILPPGVVSLVGQPPAGPTLGVSTTSGNGLYLEPGFLLMFSLGSVLLGTDLSVLLIPSRDALMAKSAAPDDAAMTIGAQIGLIF